MPLLPVGGNLASWVEISAGWISFARDRRCLNSERWKLALFGLGERKRMEGRRRGVESVLHVLSCILNWRRWVMMEEIGAATTRRR